MFRLLLGYLDFRVVFFCDCTIVCVTIQPLAAIQLNHLLLLDTADAEPVQFMCEFSVYSTICLEWVIDHVGLGLK